MKLAIICTHPIQYYVPVFKLLAQNIELKVFYTAGKGLHFDKGFNQLLNWDIPLFDGYLFEFMHNTAKEPGSHHFMGIRNPDVIKHISNFKPDYLLVYGWAYFSHLKILRYFKGKVPILFRGDSTLLNKQSVIKGLLKSIFLKYLYGHLDKAFYVGINNKAYFKKYGMKEEQLVFAPHAVNNEHFSRKSTSDIRFQLHIEQHEILILFAGKFESIKNPELLMEAFIALNLLNVHLLYVGSGVLGTKLKSRAVHYKNIHFMPFQNQSMLPAVYQSCDLFCLPSKNDSWGLAVNEAMAAGKAIIVSDKTGAAKDLVTPFNGSIFQSDNLTDLKNKLSELVSNRELLHLKGKHSKEIISSWNFENQVKNMLNEIAN